MKFINGPLHGVLRAIPQEDIGKHVEVPFLHEGEVCVAVYVPHPT